MSLIKHRTADEPMESMFDLLPSVRWLEERFKDVNGGHLIKVEQFTEDGTFVVKAEMPGIDPEKDVEITVDRGVLHIRAERREEEEKTEREFTRRELRYGSFARTLTLPEGVDEEAVTASYTNGVLEVRVPMPAEPPKEEARRVAVTTT